ncbi:MAG: hypothetical protein WBP10_03445 [Thermoanaerobaculia bacterium]
MTVRRHKRLNPLWMLVLLGICISGLAVAQAEQPDTEAAGADEGEEAASEISDEERATMALDSTATQWSFQFAWQAMPDYHDDTLADGTTRPAGNTDFLQLRIVAPIPLKGFTILPRVTIRHYENAQGQSGIGNTEIFGLIIPKSWDWGSGRFGIGPLVTLPGDEEVARDEWGYGLAMAVVNAKGNWFYGILMTQVWRAVDPDQQRPPGPVNDTNPLGIVPIVNYKLAKGWYISNGDMVAQYDWESGQLYIPIAFRLGKVFVKAKHTWNFYGEYRTSLIYKGWNGSAVKNSYRINATYSIPVG